MPDLLLELFSEEIPARMQVRAASDLENAVNKALLGAGFMPEGIKAFATPRRLTVVATGLPISQPDRREEKKGPRVGAPEKAVAGFLKSTGLSSIDQCEQREDKKGAYYVAVIDQKGKDTSNFIASLVPEIVAKFSWPKSMRWGADDLRWVRPLHSVLCAFNGEIVAFDIGAIKSSDKTAGHRFMAPMEIQTRNFEDYESRLRAAKVILATDERKEIIARDAATLCKAQSLELVEDAGLLNEVAGLAEWPVAMMGSFDEKFLALPDEVLTASMRGHQKYFSVRDPKTGGLANRFICVANMEAPDGGKAMREGYERVLTARLSDGWYLYNQDLKTSLEDRVKELDKVTFFEGLGSVGDKARRIAALAKEIAPAVGADPETAAQAAMLAKTDLVTGMVKEFPELQGVMGRYYYLAQSGLTSSFEARSDKQAPQDEGGLAAATPNNPHPEVRAQRASKDGKKAPTDQQIADAIRDHYKPAGQDDAVPTAPVSVAVAIADKIDTLTAFWAIDKKPTGSSDPFALRRAALGVIQMLLERGCNFAISEFLYKSLDVTLGDERLVNLCLDTVLLTSASSSDVVFDVIQKLKKFGIIFSHLNSDGRIDDFLSEQSSKKGDRFDSKINLVMHLTHIPVLHEEHLRTQGKVNKPSYTKEAREQALGNWNKFVSKNVGEVLYFFHDRLKVYLKDKGHRHDAINAARIDAEGNLQDDLVLIVAKLTALEAFLKTDDGANLAAAYKRAANILKAEEKKPVREGAQTESAGFNSELMIEPEEKSFFTALVAAEAKTETAVEAEDFEAAMTALSSLRAPVDQFFEHVKVNDDDQALRANRLALLARFRAATAKVADFSKLEG